MNPTFKKVTQFQTSEANLNTKIFKDASSQADKKRVKFVFFFF